MPSNAADVPSNVSDAGAGASEGTGRQRSERLRAKRGEAGLAQVSGWVPKERRAYAREVLAALARGANSLPPDPQQAAELEAARAKAETAKAAELSARAALAAAERHGQELAAELDAARVRAEAAERTREETASALRAAEETAATARAEARRFQEAPGLRGRMVRWLVR